MAKYTSDANLIRGAATAYKNYDNAPGMYAGLDKAIKAGTDTMNTAVENKRVAEAKALKKKEEEEKRAKELNNAFYEMSAPIHEAAGGFDEVTGKYASVAAKLEELQPRYIDVMQNGTATEKASVQKEYNNIKNDVSLNVEYRASVADPKNGISVAAMGIGDGRDLEFVTKYLGDKVKADPKPNEKGEETYTIDINGTPMTKTFAEINAMTIFSDQKVFIDVLDVTKKLGSSLKGAELDEYTRQDFEREIRSTLPDEENAMLAFMNDKGFDGKGFIDLISKSNNRASIEEEIMSMEEFNANGGGISQPEWENFTKAMTNPYHKTWEKADGTHDKKAWFEMSQQIVTEQMANGAENRHVLNNPPKELVTDPISAAMLKLRIAESEKQKVSQTNINLAFNVEKQFDEGETTIKGGEDRLAQLVPENTIKVDDDGNVLKEEDWRVEPAYWALTAKGSIYGTIPASEKDVRNEIIKHITGTGINPALGTTRTATAGPNKGRLMIYRGNGNYELVKEEQ